MTLKQTVKKAEYEGGKPTIQCFTASHVPDCFFIEMSNFLESMLVAWQLLTAKKSTL